MIYNLSGTYESPLYKKNTHICLYHNNLFEDYPPHWHMPVELVMPIENSYTIIANDQTYEIQPYDILFIGSGVIHSTIAPENGQRYFLQIDVSRLKNITGINSILSFIGKSRLFTPDNSPNIHRKLVKLFEEICEEYGTSEDFDSMYLNDDATTSKYDAQEIDEISSTTLCEPIIYAKLLTMLTLIGRNHLDSIESSTTSPVKKMEYAGKLMAVCRYIDEHFTDDITLEEVAEKAGFSKFHFSRLFKQFTNDSFYKYVNQQRMAYAEELLSNPDLSITQIGIQCGYSSTSSFIRMFKQFQNCTPTDFRKLREQYSFRSGQRLPTTISEEQTENTN